MVIEEISAEKYEKLFQSEIIYNKLNFNQLNVDKVNRLICLVGKENGKSKVGFIAGLKDNWLLCPFSAPFSSWSICKNKYSVNVYELFIVALNQYVHEKGLCGCRVILPPALYNQDMIVKTVNVCLRNQYRIKHMDLNYALHMADFKKNGYLAGIASKTRNMVTSALKKNLEFVRCEDNKSKELAYNVIQENHRLKGYPVRMSLSQLMDTTRLFQSDFFVVKSCDKAVAAAIIYHTTDSVVQVIYWGDIPDEKDLHGMNFLAYKLVEYYMELGIDIIDIGISTEDGVPNVGLCDFKESIGCRVSEKYTLEYRRDE